MACPYFTACISGIIAHCYLADPAEFAASGGSLFYGFSPDACSCRYFRIFIHYFQHPGSFQSDEATIQFSGRLADISNWFFNWRLADSICRNLSVPAFSIPLDYFIVGKQGKGIRIAASSFSLFSGCRNSIRYSMDGYGYVYGRRSLSEYRCCISACVFIVYRNPESGLHFS